MRWRVCEVEVWVMVEVYNFVLKVVLDFVYCVWLVVDSVGEIFIFVFFEDR